jgi:hypothetical protein
MPYKYKIILKDSNNLIAECIYSKIKDIKHEDRIYLINNTNKYILDHILLPIYEKNDIEDIIYNYGIQSAIQHYILNKRYYNNIIELVDNDENKVYIGIAYYILTECFDYIIDIDLNVNV